MRALSASNAQPISASVEDEKGKSDSCCPASRDACTVMHVNVQLKAGEADIVITSPPYWLKRDYGVAGQIWPGGDRRRVCRQPSRLQWKTGEPSSRSGIVFMNIGDTYHNGSLANTPGRLEFAAHNAGWTVRNRIIWIKRPGMPDPAKDRLKSRHEYIIHFTMQRA